MKLLSKLSMLSIACVIALTACNGKTSGNNSETVDSAVVVAEKIYTPAEISENGASLIDSTVQVKGEVMHVCKHSGKKCFLASADNDSVKIQVMAGGEIEMFDKALMGSEIVAKGVVKEHQITKEMIEKQEKAAKQGKEGEHCGTEMERIGMMKAWMEKNGKDYYPIYYIEGESYKANE